MTIKEAEQIVRSFKNVNTVWYGFPYKDSFGFVTSPNSKVIFGDVQAVFMKVDKNKNIEVERFMPTDVDKNTFVYFDMNPSDLSRIK